MPETNWSDDALRKFLTDIRSGGFFGPDPGIDDTARERFRAEAMRRIVPVVQRRVLAEVGGRRRRRVGRWRRVRPRAPRADFISRVSRREATADAAPRPPAR